MKFSLRKIIENKNERDPSIDSSEAHRFLIFLQSNHGYGYHPRALGNIFSEFNKNVAEDFIEELVRNGWIKKDYFNQLDLGIFVTEKTVNLFKIKFDYIDETKKLIAMLQVEKLESFASTLQAVLSSACNSTELLMGLKFHLDEILVSKVLYPIRVQSEMMIKEINAILER